MPKIEHNGQTYLTDFEGFLLHFEDWNKDWADYVRGLEGIYELSDEHWKVLNTLRGYYEENNFAPLTVVVCRSTGIPLGRIFDLFPSGFGRGACKMAGLPRPTSS